MASLSLGKRSICFGNKVTEGRHVVARETQGMVQAAQRQLHVTVAAALQLPERLETAQAILAVRGYREIQLAGKIPEGIVFGLVQPLAVGKIRIAHRNSTEFHHGAARFL